MRRHIKVTRDSRPKRVPNRPGDALQAGPGANSASPSRPANISTDIAIINRVSQSARGSWFGLIGYLAFIGVAILGIRDADFFLASRQTRLPIVGVDIPTRSFFALAPAVGAALYVYLHLHLIKIWQATGRVRQLAGGEALIAQATPWLVTDLAATFIGHRAAPPRPLTWLSNLVTCGLVWVAGPLILLSFWMRAAPAHAEWLSLFLLAVVGVTVFTGGASWWVFSAAMKGETAPRNPWARPWRWGPCLAIFLFLAALSWLRTEGDFRQFAYSTEAYDPEEDEPDIWQDLKRHYPLASARLAEVELVARSTRWTSYAVHKRNFRNRWCGQQAIPAQVCGDALPATIAPPPYQAARRAEWCRDGWTEGMPEAQAAAACQAFFEALDIRFFMNWRNERSSWLGTFAGLKLAGADLRMANAGWAFLPAADLRVTRMDGAELIGAKLEMTQLSGASLIGTSLRRTRLERADLADAVIDRADMRGARMEGTDLRRTRVTRSVLRTGRLDWADMRGATLDMLDLRQARMRRVRWGRADLGTVLLHGADLRGAFNLTQDQLSRAVGDADTLLPPGLFVWSCQERLPEDFYEIREIWAELTGQSPGRLIGLYGCGDGEVPQKTGRALDLNVWPAPDGVSTSP